MQLHAYSVDDLNDSFRCILATGGKEHAEGAGNPRDVRMMLFCQRTLLVLTDKIASSRIFSFGVKVYG